MKRIFAVLLALLLIFSLSAGAFAADAEAETAAQELFDLGLFSGTGTDAAGKPVFDLDRAPTRAEAVTMLVRLLGKSDAALAGAWTTPFTDVADWAKPYVGFAYANGLTAGTSATTFGGGDTVSAAQYLTFVLRALGYASGTDFQWDRAWELTDRLGVTDGRYGDGTAFTRGDAAIVSRRALDTAVKGGTLTLLQTIRGEAPDTAITFSGTGDQVITGVNIPAGSYYAEYIHSGKSNFITRFYYGDKEYDYVRISNEIGRCSGQVSMWEDSNLAVTNGMLSVRADGNWTISFKPVSGKTTTNVSGHGEVVTGIFTATSARNAVSMTHKGESNFIAKVIEYNADERYDYESLANEIGVYSGQKLITLTPGVQYFFYVRADGDWTINFGTGDALTTYAPPAIP